MSRHHDAREDLFCILCGMSEAAADEDECVQRLGHEFPAMLAAAAPAPAKAQEEEGFGMTPTPELLYEINDEIYALGVNHGVRLNDTALDTLVPVVAAAILAAEKII